MDTTVEILEIRPEQESLWFTLSLPAAYARYVVPKGYVALDGTSLTVCDVTDNVEFSTHHSHTPVHTDTDTPAPAPTHTSMSTFTVMLVDYTQKHVTLPHKKPGDAVNLEVDMIGKYVERCVQLGKYVPGTGGGSSGTSTSTSTSGSSSSDVVGAMASR